MQCLHPVSCCFELWGILLLPGDPSLAFYLYYCNLDQPIMWICHCFLICYFIFTELQNHVLGCKTICVYNMIFFIRNPYVGHDGNSFSVPKRKVQYYSTFHNGSWLNYFKNKKVLNFSRSLFKYATLLIQRNIYFL